MNILFIGHEHELNGASRSLVGMINELSKDNNIHVLTAYKKGAFIDEIKTLNVEVIYSKYFRWMIFKPNNSVKWILKKNLFIILNLVNIISALKVVVYCKKNRIDIIHSNSSVINIGAIISKFSQIPHVFHIREFGEEDFNMHSIYNKRRHLRFINKNTRKVIAISNSILNKYLKYFEKDKIEMIYNGIDMKLLNEKERIEKEEFNVLLAGRIEEAKGQKEAILAMKELKNIGINKVNLYIIGSGDRESLINLCNQLNVADLVNIQGYSNNLFEFRKEIDFELVCSKNEAFGRVTIEAMMSSNPVIGANTGGTKELIIDGYNGYLYEQGNPKDLANKVNFLISNFNNLKIIGKNAFEYSRTKFTSEINANNIRKLYYKIINNN